MPIRDGYIPGVPCWVDTSQPEPEKAVDFYRELFGWEFEDVMPPGSEGEYYIARLHGGDVAAVGSIRQSAPRVATWNTYVWVDSVDDTAAKVRDAGGTVMVEPMDVMDFGRMGVFIDPEGAAFVVWQAYQHKGAQVVNEAGALNFNGLHTRDVDGARSFYGAVFGWELLTLDGGAQMWALPGYGDHLEIDNPDLRKQMAEAEAPSGFEDVVASINPIAADDADTRPGWSITMGVDDTHATAARAAELGGRVIVPPLDVPWSRMTVIADPQGATFIASQFVPENRDIGAEPG
jgi:predicted enzyme related to lactoylglutathione lyase